MNPLYVSCAVVSCFDNDNSAYIPEIWSQTGLMILEENMVAPNLVLRDFDDAVAKFGDVVNTRRPNDHKVTRRIDGADLVPQDAKSTNVQVPLDQWFNDAFIIYDGEGSKSFQELINIYLKPAMINIARGVERAIWGRAQAFLGSPSDRVGRLAKITGATSSDLVVEASEKLNTNRAPMAGRNLVVGPKAYSAFLKNPLFVKADERGDGGQTLATGRLGEILGFQTYLAQDIAGVLTGLDTDVTATVTNALAAGSGGSQEIGSGDSGISVGEYFVVDGNDQPTFITALAGTVDHVTLNESNKFSTLAGATSVRYKHCAATANYAAGWTNYVNVDGYTTAKAPQIGQLLAFGTGGNRRLYTIIESTDNGSNADLLLDRPLEVAVANNDLAFPGPAGSLNLAFHPNALAFVTRPLATPHSNFGVMSNVAVFNNIAMRVTMQYDINKQGTVVNLDILAGIAQLDSRLGVPVLG